MGVGLGLRLVFLDFDLLEVGVVRKRSWQNLKILISGLEVFLDLGSLD